MSNLTLYNAVCNAFNIGLRLGRKKGFTPTGGYDNHITAELNAVMDAEALRAELLSACRAAAVQLAELYDDDCPENQQPSRFLYPLRQVRDAIAKAEGVPV